MMEQLLIIEDDKELNHGLCKALQSEYRQVVSCMTLKAAREQLLCTEPSLVLLDINLPDGSGLEFMQEFKQNHAAVPVILLTANDTDMDIVQGLESGADDYITKPFSLSVLRARVNTQFRKNHTVPNNGQYIMGRYCFDFEQMAFTVDGQSVELSKTEQKLLRLLVENQGIVVSRNTLVDRIWTDGASFVDENALSVTVKRLRDKLGTQAAIKTVYGIGYSWENNHG
jgi:DNA-binding response OmpR family regulator